MTSEGTSSSRKTKDMNPRIRCAWARTPISIAYHDNEWGVPVHDDRTLFEFLTLEGLPSDHYLWLTGMGSKLLRGEIKGTGEPPLRQPAGGDHPLHARLPPLFQVDSHDRGLAAGLAHVGTQQHRAHLGRAEELRAHDERVGHR